ncbi:TetR/AcrR family transcriptional regulator [Lactococcus formosensis]|uniref:TetR/AcrR family transcriptional regulator n=1 Tax=Lactococcus formosensis TaxID=1281486 RepID=UPI0013FE33EB|nr:TetR/AcrR family transcriptional regulator [Lactococcus formosensis]NHI67447.1 TetR/AcrR family transcriptional regulator [Lactococcus garvieae]
MAKNTKEIVIRTLLNIAAEGGIVNIEEIPRRTGITRNTIRYNFGNQGIDSIIAYIYSGIFQEINTQLFRHSPNEIPVEIFADIILHILWEHRDEAHILVTSKLLYRTDIGAIDLVYPWAKERYDYLVKVHQLSPYFSSKQLLSFWISYLDIIFTLWFSVQIPLTPEKFKPIFLKLVKTSMYDLIYKDIGH